MINLGEITELSYNLNETFKEIDAIKIKGVLSIESIRHWIKLCNCLLPDCTEFIKLYKMDYNCIHPVCVCKITCSCGKCTYCDVQKFQGLYDSFNDLITHYSYKDRCKLAIEEYKDRILKEMNIELWCRKHKKLYGDLILFHYNFDKDFDLPSHEGYENRVFVNNEIEVSTNDFIEILEFLDLYERAEITALEKIANQKA